MSICFEDSGTESSDHTSIAMSKSSSSASNTTTSTSSADASALEGLEHVRINQFVGIESLQKAINLRSKSLQQHVSNQQYLVFRPVTKVDLAKVEDVRKSIGNIRMAHHTDIDLLIVKLMPSAEHEAAHLSFVSELHTKVIGMGMSIRELRPLGGTRFPGHTSSKEGDSTFKPSSRKNKTDWPTIVIESGLSESLPHLRSDATWWFDNSNGDVKIVVIISIKPVQKRLRIERWELAVPDDGQSRHPGTQIPTRIQEITIIPNESIAGAPLVLGFEKIFLRPAITPESNFIFTEEDLSSWADAFWGTVV